MSLFKESLLRQAEQVDALPPPQHTALIVDDEISNLRVLRSILSRRFRVLEAGDGAEALELLARLSPAEMPALILSDQRMPRMTGVEMFERLREILPSAIRIIVTGFVDLAAVGDAVQRAGIYKLVVKPYDQNELHLTIDGAIAAYEAAAAIAPCEG